MFNPVQIFDLKTLLYLNRIFLNYGFINKLFAEYLTYLMPVILVVLWFKAKKESLRAFFSVMLAWPIFGTLIGKIVDRPRPFENGGVQELIFHRPTYSFPSDHAAALFAVFFSLYLSGFKKLSYIMLGVAVLVSFFRIATAIHWPTDIVAGAVVGIGSAYLIQVLDKYLNKLYEFIIGIAKKLRLA